MGADSANSKPLDCESEMHSLFIPLSLEALVSFTRRNRNIFRRLQQKFTNVAFKVDRLNKGVQVHGPESQLEEVRLCIVGLADPPLQVPPKVWAELMRTRHEGPSAIVEVIQKQSGCRLHIERTRHEVRLFGDTKAIGEATELLSDLADKCSEEAVLLKQGSWPSAEALQSMALKNKVTFRCEEHQVIALGLTEAVSAAVKELYDSMSQREKHVDDQSVDSKASTNETVIAKPRVRISHVASAGALHSCVAQAGRTPKSRTDSDPPKAKQVRHVRHDTRSAVVPPLPPNTKYGPHSMQGAKPAAVQSKPNSHTMPEAGLTSYVQSKGTKLGPHSMQRTKPAAVQSKPHSHSMPEAGRTSHVQSRGHFDTIYDAGSADVHLQCFCGAPTSSADHFCRFCGVPTSLVHATAHHLLEGQMLRQMLQQSAIRQAGNSARLHNPQFLFNSLTSL